MKYIFTFLLIAAVSASCSPEKKYADELSEIENYEKGIDSLAAKYRGIKFDSLAYIQSRASESEKMIKAYYMADTISMSLAERLRFMKSVRKSLSRIKDREKSLDKEIRTLRKQFKNLSADIKSGIYGKDKVAEYLEAEKRAFETLNENLNTVIENQNKQLHDFYYSYPMVQEYIELIKPKEDQY